MQNFMGYLSCYRARRWDFGGLESYECCASVAMPACRILRQNFLPYGPKAKTFRQNLRVFSKYLFFFRSECVKFVASGYCDLAVRPLRGGGRNEAVPTQPSPTSPHLTPSWRMGSSSGNVCVYY